jgi:cholesterol transport system auxiliary component
MTGLFLKVSLMWLFLASPVLLLAGCGTPPALINKYILEYPPPDSLLGSKAAAIKEPIRVERFAAAQPFDSSAMIYRPDSFKSEAYTYNRWRVNPGTMVTDYLTRDMRDSGLFTAVFAPGNSGKGRFLVEGTVQEFQELDEPDGWKGALALNVTFLDAAAEEIPQKVIFQKNYLAEEPLEEKTPKGLARAMSRAMRTLSAQIMSDLYQAAQKRVGKTGKP